MITKTGCRSFSFLDKSFSQRLSVFGLHAIFLYAGSEKHSGAETITVSLFRFVSEALRQDGLCRVIRFLMWIHFVLFLLLVTRGHCCDVAGQRTLCQNNGVRINTITAATNVSSHKFHIRCYRGLLHTHISKSSSSPPRMKFTTSEMGRKPHGRRAEVNWRVIVGDVRSLAKQKDKLWTLTDSELHKSSTLFFMEMWLNQEVLERRASITGFMMAHPSEMLWRDCYCSQRMTV